MLLADLSNDLADAKLQAARLKTELADREDQIGLLKHIAGAGNLSTLKYDGSVYREDGDDEGAFYPSCYDTKSVRIRLTKQFGVWAHLGEWECPSCKNAFGKSTA
jgi:hypothetical protein